MAILKKVIESMTYILDKKSLENQGVTVIEAG